MPLNPYLYLAFPCMQFCTLAGVCKLLERTIRRLYPEQYAERMEAVAQQRAELEAAQQAELEEQVGRVTQLMQQQMRQQHQVVAATAAALELPAPASPAMPAAGARSHYASEMATTPLATTAGVPEPFAMPAPATAAAAQAFGTAPNAQVARRHRLFAVRSISSHALSSLFSVDPAARPVQGSAAPPAPTPPMTQQQQPSALPHLWSPSPAPNSAQRQQQAAAFLTGMAPAPAPWSAGLQGPGSAAGTAAAALRSPCPILPASPHDALLHMQHAMAEEGATNMAPGSAAAAAAAWQDPEVDMPVRQEVARRLVTMLYSRRPDMASAARGRLPEFVQRVETALYRSAPSRAAYEDVNTLEARVQRIARGAVITRRLQQRAHATAAPAMPPAQFLLNAAGVGTAAATPVVAGDLQQQQQLAPPQLPAAANMASLLL